MLLVKYFEHLYDIVLESSFWAMKELAWWNWIVNHSLSLVSTFLYAWGQLCLESISLYINIYIHMYIYSKFLWLIQLIENTIRLLQQSHTVLLVILIFFFLKKQTRWEGEIMRLKNGVIAILSELSLRK